MDLMTFLFGDGSCVMAWQAIPAVLAIVQMGMQMGQQAKAAKMQEEASDDAKELAAAGGGVGYGGVPSAATPSISGPDYRQNENAFWQQAFAGMGQGLPGGVLPPGIQDSIERQAALLPKEV